MIRTKQKPGLVERLYLELKGFDHYEHVLRSGSELSKAQGIHLICSVCSQCKCVFDMSGVPGCVHSAMGNWSLRGGNDGEGDAKHAKRTATLSTSYSKRMKWVWVKIQVSSKHPKILRQRLPLQGNHSKKVPMF